MKPINTSFALFSALALFPALALALQDPNPKLFDKIHHVNQKEIAMGKVALEKSQSPDVRKFAQEMIDEHTTADQKLTTLAQSKGMELTPFEPAGYEKADQDRLSKLSGADFDLSYATEMKKGHEKFLGELTSARKHTHDAETTTLLDDLIPTVKAHEKMAKDLKKELKS